ncbi:MAG: hypothetical protein HZB41_12445 [Ignavibacteriae bacterium]|nr:hypothetical protein [Ignavibacteriota bacterium]
MNESNKIVKKESNIEKTENSEILMKQILLRELKEKIRDKINNNDPMFMKTLKYMLNDTINKNEKE